VTDKIFGITCSATLGGGVLMAGVSFTDPERAPVGTVNVTRSVDHDAAGTLLPLNRIVPVVEPRPVPTKDTVSPMVTIVGEADVTCACTTRVGRATATLSTVLVRTTEPPSASGTWKVIPVSDQVVRTGSPPSAAVPAGPKPLPDTRTMAPAKLGELPEKLVTCAAISMVPAFTAIDTGGSVFAGDVLELYGAWNLSATGPAQYTEGADNVSFVSEPRDTTGASDLSLPSQTTALGAVVTVRPNVKLEPATTIVEASNGATELARFATGAAQKL
jgi:hypothetical protein